MLSGVKIDREQQKIWRSVKTYPPPTPRTLRAAESSAERAELAGRTLLLLLVPVENHNDNNNNNNNNKSSAVSETLPLLLPRIPRAAESTTRRAKYAEGRTNKICC